MRETENEFCQLVAQMRSGDPAAMAEFVNRYEQHMRRVIRRRLSKTSRRTIHMSDVFQSALVGFLEGIDRDRIRIGSEEEFLSAWSGIVANKVRKEHRRQRTRCEYCDTIRDQLERRLRQSEERARPETIAVIEDEVCHCFQRLSREECFLMRSVMWGTGWDEIATLLKSSHNAVRMRYRRLIERIRGAIGNEEDRDVRGELQE